MFLRAKQLLRPPSIRRLFSASNIPENPSTSTPDHDNSSPQAAFKHSALSNPPNSQFLERLKRMENDYKQDHNRRLNRNLWSNLKVPALILLGSFASYLIWQTRRENSVFRHLTLGEHTLRDHYYHTLLTASLSFKTIGQLITYIPPMVYASLALSRFMTNKHFALLFLLNSLISSAVTITYEKYNEGFNNKSMMPKINGSSTALALTGCLFGMHPSHMLFGIRLLPFAFFPVALFFYELSEYHEVYVKEISRPAHIVSLLNGVILGLLLRRFGIIKLSN